MLSSYVVEPKELHYVPVVKDDAYFKKRGLEGWIADIRCPKCDGPMLKTRENSLYTEYKCGACNVFFRDEPRTIGWWDNGIRKTRVEHKLEEVGNGKTDHR